jgi:hypothetical protein
VCAVRSIASECGFLRETFVFVVHLWPSLARDDQKQQTRESVFHQPILIAFVVGNWAGEELAQQELSKY